MLYAHCYQSGEIVFSRTDDKEGMICFASGPNKTLRKTVSARARLAYDNKTLLVPGLPEADNDKSASDAVRKFSAWCKVKTKADAAAFAATFATADGAAQ